VTDLERSSAGLAGGGSAATPAPVTTQAAAPQAAIPSAGCPPPHPSPRRPSLALPPGSCDSHCHVFGPAAIFPYSEDRTFTPAEAAVEELMARHGHLGIQRAVIIQSACYGPDHSVLLDALHRGEGRYRGVALIDDRTPRTEIERLHAAGVRGFRVHFLPHLRASLTWEDVAATAVRVADLGWHAEIHVQADGVVRFADAMLALPVPAVIDHLGRVDMPQDIGQVASDALRRLLDSGNVWLKTSGVDRVSREGPPFRDAVVLAAGLVAYAPDRVVWGTDFPHPNIAGDAPDDGQLVDLLADIAPGPEALRRLLVLNPIELFGFDRLDESA
jgi:2-pyrone-4,6-dicarboxylate lactonase